MGLLDWVRWGGSSGTWANFARVDIVQNRGRLVSLIAEGDEKAELTRRAGGLASVQLDARALCDLEMLATGAFSPLDRFMGRADAQRVADEMRLVDGTLFPVPVTLAAERTEGIEGREIALRNANNNLVGWMKVEEVWEAGTRTGGRFCLSGPLRAMELPRHPDFPGLRRTPSEVRAVTAAMGRERVLAFEPVGAISRALEELARQAARELDASLLIHAAVGMALAGDIGHYARVRSYRQLVENYFDAGSTCLNLMPLAAREGGPREALWHAIVERNYGATHLLVEEGPACELVGRHSAETGVAAVAYGTGAAGGPYRQETADILADLDPPRDRQGFCIWFTGLPSSGKSTVAEALIVMLLEHGRRVTVLDGDVVRTHLSKGLTFSREDRDTNILRVGFVASEIVRHHGAVICAAVSPYRQTRDQVRAMMAHAASREDAFVEVFVDTPAAECERRDVKGFYAQAREGKIKGFTGVDDPYEPPLAPEIRLSTMGTTAVENAGRIVEFLAARGLVSKS